MAIKGVSHAEREEIILPSDPGHPDHEDYKAAIKAGREPEKPTKFFVGNLSKGCRIELGDIGTSPTMREGAITMENRRTKRSYEAVQRALRGWENFTDASGNPIPFELGTVMTNSGPVKGATDETMTRLSADIIFELAEAVLEKNGMIRGLAKGSEAPLSQLGEAISEIGAATTAPQSNENNEDANDQP